MCFAENSKPPGKPFPPEVEHRCGPSRNLRKGLIEEEVPKELRWERICIQCRRPEFNPWIEKTLRRKEWLPTPVFLLGEFHEQKSLVGYSLWGPKESDTTEKLTHKHIHGETD